MLERIFVTAMVTLIIGTFANLDNKGKKKILEGRKNNQIKYNWAIIILIVFCSFMLGVIPCVLLSYIDETLGMIGLIVGTLLFIFIAIKIYKRYLIKQLNEYNKNKK